MRFLSVLSVLASASVSVLAQETATSITTSTQTNAASSCDAQKYVSQHTQYALLYTQVNNAPITQHP